MMIDFIREGCYKYRLQLRIIGVIAIAMCVLWAIISVIYAGTDLGTSLEGLGNIEEIIDEK